MRPSIKCLLTATLALLLTLPVAAQLVPGGMPAMQNGMQGPLLLLNKSVQQELKMTPQQNAKVTKIVEGTRDKYGPQLREAFMSKDREKIVKVVGASTEETRKNIETAMPDILKPEQVSRLKQVELQVNGIAAFRRPEVQQSLNLTDKQKEELKEIGAALRQDVTEYFKDAQGQPRKLLGAAEKVRSLTQAATKKALALLDEEQNKTWKEMTGKKFDFKVDAVPGIGGRP
jgi:Spy/CpxP family protein refolding chaperone